MLRATWNRVHAWPQLLLHEESWHALAIEHGAVIPSDGEFFTAVTISVNPRKTARSEARGAHHHVKVFLSPRLRLLGGECPRRRCRRNNYAHRAPPWSGEYRAADAR